MSPPFVLSDMDLCLLPFDFFAFVLDEYFLFFFRNLFSFKISKGFQHFFFSSFKLRQVRNGIADRFPPFCVVRRELLHFFFSLAFPLYFFFGSRFLCLTLLFTEEAVKRQSDEYRNLFERSCRYKVK